MSTVATDSADSSALVDPAPVGLVAQRPLGPLPHEGNALNCRMVGGSARLTNQLRIGAASS